MATRELSMTRPVSRKVPKPIGKRIWHHASSLLFVLPFLVAFFLFIGYPAVFGFWVSLSHWNPLAGYQGSAGISQYTSLFDKNNLAAGQFWGGMVNTVTFVLISVPLLLAVPTALAYLIYRSPLKALFRAVYFFPTVLSVTAVTSLWTWLMQTQGGGINTLLGLHIPWLVEQPWAWISIDLATLWWTMGFNLIILYAGFTQLSTTTIEAASIDGAGAFRTFWSIALPQVRPVLAFIVVTSTIASFNLFAQSLLMTGGGPGSSTQSLTMVIYNQGFNAMHMGSASAMAYLMALILAIISFIQYRLTRERS